MVGRTALARISSVSHPGSLQREESAAEASERSRSRAPGAASRIREVMKRASTPELQRALDAFTKAMDDLQHIRTYTYRVGGAAVFGTYDARKGVPEHVRRNQEKDP